MESREGERWQRREKKIFEEAMIKIFPYLMKPYTYNFKKFLEAQVKKHKENPSKGIIIKLLRLWSMRKKVYYIL